MRRIVMVSLLLGGCTVGPNYRPPEAKAPAAFTESQPTVADPVDLASWWTSFRDPVLDGLVARAMAHSPDIYTAASRVRQARLQEVIAGAANKPTLDATAGATHIELSKNAGFSSLIQQFSGGGGSTGGGAGGSSGAPAGITTPGSGITTYSLGFDASWEIDLFGGGRRQVEAARARTAAAVWNERDAAVTLASEVASTYFQLRLDQLQIAVLRDELTRQNRALEISGNTAKAGLVPQNDVTRQRASITDIEARMAPIQADATVQVHALAVLLGTSPEGFAVASGDSTTHVPQVPAGLPSDLIRRRPDVRAAERSLAAATADIGVATADLYPKFTLTGMAQLISSSLGNLFTGDSVQLTASGQAMFPILDWGRRRSTVKLRREDAEQAYQQWRTAVLGAYRDVEDALSRLAAERRRNEALARAVNDRLESATALEARYRTGFVAQDQLLQAEVDVLSAREQQASSDAQLRRYTVALFKALGGGWREGEPAQ